MLADQAVYYNTYAVIRGISSYEASHHRRNCLSLCLGKTESAMKDYKIMVCQNFPQNVGNSIAEPQKRLIYQSNSSPP